MSATPGFQFPNWMIPDINAELFCAVGISTAIGDLLYFDQLGNKSASPTQLAVPKPVSQLLDQGSAIATQELAAQWFLGVSNTNQLAADTTLPSSATHPCKILVDRLWEYPCVSQTFELGDMLTFNYTATGTSGALSDQLLTKTTNPASAIARVDRRYTSPTTRVKCRIISRLLVAGWYNDGSVVNLAGINLIGPVASPPAASITLITGGTIIPGGYSNSIIINPIAVVTGAVMAPGQVDGQEVTILNLSGNSVTFAAAATSLVADGVSAVIPALRSFFLQWSATASLWLHT